MYVYLIWGRNNPHIKFLSLLVIEFPICKYQCNIPILKFLRAITQNFFLIFLNFEMNSAHYNSQISMHLFYSVCVGKKWQLIYFNLIRIYKYLTINGREKVPWNHLSKQALTTVLIINCWHRDMSGSLFFLR